MAKERIGVNPMLTPAPVVMVSCGSRAEQQNILTIAWTGIINSKPPMTYISVQPSRYSHPILMEEREFVINITTQQLAFATDFCGVRSGRQLNKFETLGLTPEQADEVACPMIKESPVNLECKVFDIRSFPTHDMFLAEIVAVHVDKELIESDGKIDLAKAKLLCYNHGEYFGLQEKAIGRFGFSVMKQKTKTRVEKEKRSASRTASRNKKKNLNKI